jgi:uncharacterized membrane protein
MSTNKELLAKALKYLSGALPLLFIGPAIIHNAFMNQKNNWHFLVLIIGIALCIYGVYCMYVGLKTIMNSLFND